jgi:hypothetical protein
MIVWLVKDSLKIHRKEKGNDTQKNGKGVWQN